MDRNGTFFDSSGSIKSDDSVELGLPHEPLSITFFKTAFSMSGLVGLSLPHSIPEGKAYRRPAVSSILLEGLKEETSENIVASEGGVMLSVAGTLAVQDACRLELFFFFWFPVREVFFVGLITRMQQHVTAVNCRWGLHIRRSAQ